MSIIDQILSVESGGDPFAKNPRSSAAGAGQFIDATWLDLIGRYRPSLAEGRSRGEILALRNDSVLSREMTEAYASENANTLSQAGLPVTPGTTYLAHFAGPQGAVNLLRADPGAPVGSVMGEAAIKANPFLQNMTVADLRAWADRKMGPKPMPVSQVVSADERPQALMGSLGPVIEAAKQHTGSDAQAASSGGMASLAQAFGAMGPQPSMQAPPLPDRPRPRPVRPVQIATPQPRGWGFSSWS